MEFVFKVIYVNSQLEQIKKKLARVFNLFLKMQRDSLFENLAKKLPLDN
jgi:hypothetical protein